MKAIKLSGVSLSEEIFGDKILKQNTWNGTGYEKARYTVLRRPIPPWSRDRMGPSIIQERYPDIARVNALFAEAASKANVVALQNAGLSGKKFLKYRAKFIGKYVREGGRVSVSDILPEVKPRRRVAPVRHITQGNNAPRKIVF